MDVASRIKVCLRRWVGPTIENPRSSAAAAIRKIVKVQIVKVNDIKIALLTKQRLANDLPASSPFYTQALQNWFAFHNFQPQDEDDVQGEYCWNNIFHLLPTKHADKGPMVGRSRHYHRSPYLPPPRRQNTGPSGTKG